jgi:hypothetical protein
MSNHLTPTQLPPFDQQKVQVQWIRLLSKIEPTTNTAILGILCAHYKGIEVQAASRYVMTSYQPIEL